MPFNFIKHAPEGEAGNMELTSMKRDGATIPLYRNKRPLDRGDELLLDSVSRMLDSACGKKEGKEVFSMKLQHITVCLYKGARAVMQAFLEALHGLARSCVVCTQSWSHVGSSLVLAGCCRLSLWQAVWLSLRQADSLAFSG